MENEIRAVLVPVEEDRKLLLPNAMVAEVMSLRDLEPYENVDEWVLGKVTWRGWDLPVVDFAVLTGGKKIERLDKSFNVAVLKCINTPEKLAYFAVLSRGIPKLQVVSRGDMQLHEDKTINHNAIASLVSIHEETADIPNMNYLEQSLIVVTQ
ncbi:chemotaxis protein CheW [Marinicella rhabdoformis]|uniref:chemotaxis protein CheW n=1 Tax=Marinicella rhabdoformis TaxID=2580566 RepID=UPI0012AEB6E9|nr:chemotaxis protein CheW [Marinicella rhabdoformis]